MENINMEAILRLKPVCVKIMKNPEKSIDDVKDLKNILNNLPTHVMEGVQGVVLTSFFPFIRPPDNNTSKINDDHKREIIEVLKIVIRSVKITKVELFYNLYGFLLFNIYDYKEQSLVRNIHEELKLSIIECMTSLFHSISWDLLPVLYVKENAQRLCQILYVCLEIAKHEKLRTLRIAAMECILAIAKLDDETYFNDIELRKNVGDVIMFFLPGMASKLKDVSIGDEKAGHKVIMMALRTWGRMVALLMEDFNPTESKPVDVEAYFATKGWIEVKEETNKTTLKHKNPSEIKDFIKKTSRTEHWYKETDQNLSKLFITYQKLVTHDNPLVRNELVDISILILNKCQRNVPMTTNSILDVLIALSSDLDLNIAQKSQIALTALTNSTNYNNLKILDYLKSHFYNAITALPRIFNGFDEKEQLQAVNIIIGYLKLFGPARINEILCNPTYLEHFMSTLIHICELERSNVSLLIDETSQDLEDNTDFRKPWTKFVYYQDELLIKSIMKLLQLMGEEEYIHITTDYLIDTFIKDNEKRLTVTFMLNSILQGVTINERSQSMIRCVVKLYLDPDFFNLPITVGEDKYGEYHALSQVKSNIIQICLECEGIGIISSALKESFARKYLLESMNEILEKAGCANPVIRLAGLSAIKNIALSCGYRSVTDLINQNPDYFSYHIIRKIDKLECNENILNVLCAVMKLTTIEVMPSISEIMESIILQSCDKFQEQLATSFLRVFKIFIESLHRWLDIKLDVPAFKSKKEKEQEYQEFYVSGVKNVFNSYSDEAVMGKSAEEMYKEDMENVKNSVNVEEEAEDIDDEEEYKKPDPPVHIKITVSILKRSLNFLPSKDKNRKILVLEILKLGLDIIKDWEDELLPIVHLIWSPFVNRFKETENPLIINLSFQLLVVLARYSKDFIRSRTTKEVLPLLRSTMFNLSKESYLKDKGSAYRYTQNFKLQCSVLEHLSRLVCDLDLNDNDIEVIMESMLSYLSNKQPKPLQKLALEFYKDLKKYDPDFTVKKLNQLQEKFVETKNIGEFEQNLKSLLNNL